MLDFNLWVILIYCTSVGFQPLSYTDLLYQCWISTFELYWFTVGYQCWISTFELYWFTVPVLDFNLWVILIYCTSVGFQPLSYTCTSVGFQPLSYTDLLYQCWISTFELYWFTVGYQCWISTFELYWFTVPVLDFNLWVILIYCTSVLPTLRQELFGIQPYWRSPLFIKFNLFTKELWNITLDLGITQTIHLWLNIKELSLIMAAALSNLFHTLTHTVCWTAEVSLAKEEYYP